MNVRYLRYLIATVAVLLCLGFILGYGFTEIPADTAVPPEANRTL